jgi:UDP-galactopyranose mutase
MNYDIIIIGAGISGATIAERYASVLNKKVLVLEKRDHIGGNCFDFYNDENILVSKYGAHLFHTNYEDVWKYVNRFSSWYPYEHRVKAQVDGKLVPVPVNITTVNELLKLQIKSEAEMKKWLNSFQIKNNNPRDSKEAALARVGQVLYEKIFKNYTKKQWNKWPEELDPLVCNRIPVRASFDDRYFSDKYQALPVNGYTQLFKKMLSHPNITVKTNIDYISVRDQLKNFEKLFYTGPIDLFFDYKYSLGKSLEYRSINFIWETYDKEYYQENSVINYPNDHDYTRIVEYKYFTGQKHPKTTISKEYSADYAYGINEPYYPVPNLENHTLYLKYRQEAQKLEKRGVYFVGRLATYKYLNMDEAFKDALDIFLGSIHQ